MSLLLALNIFYNFFGCFYCWLWGPHCIRLEKVSIRKCPKYFKASGFPCCILNKLTFSEAGHDNQKNVIIWRKVGTSTNKMVYPEGTFLWWGLFIPGFKTIAYVLDKQSDICRTYLLLHRLCVLSVKTTTYVCNRFNTSFCARDHKKTRLYQI